MPVRNRNRSGQRGRTASPYGLSQRREIAFDKFMKGWTNAEVSNFLAVHPDTVARYRSEYEDKIELLARNNPGMLTEVIQNTIRALEELDTVRATAWREYESTAVWECESCGGEIQVPALSPSSRNSFLKTVLTAQEQRHRLFGLFGVKQEFFLQVQQVKLMQEKLLEFMQRELCPADRAKLERYMMGVDAPASMPIIPAELVGGSS